MKSTTQRSLTLLFVLVGVSVLSACIGAFIAGNTLDAYREALEEQVVSVTQVTSVKPPVVPGTIQESIAAVREGMADATLPLIDPRASIHAQGVVRSQSVGMAVPLTTDGWVMLPDRLMRDYGERLELVLGNELFEIGSGVVDPATGYRFVKTEIQEVRVGTFGASEQVRAGDLVYVVFDGRIMPRTVLDEQAYVAERAVQSSDQLDRRFLLDQVVDVPSGAVVTDGAGALLGVMDTELLVRPLHHLTSALESVLLVGDIDRPALNVQTMDVSRVVLEHPAREGLIVQRVGVGPAREAGLLLGDVIVRVQGESVHALPLSEFVARAAVGETLVLSVDREGTMEEISVTLE